MRRLFHFTVATLLVLLANNAANGETATDNGATDNGSKANAVDGANKDAGSGNPTDNAPGAGITCPTGQYKLSQKRGTNNWCGTNQCSCPKGFGVRGQDCPKHGEHKCASCVYGYTLNKAQHKCEKTTCRLGLYATGNTCLTKKCRCPNGYGTIGTHCKKHGDIDCRTCKYGYTLDKVGNKCVNLALCKCTNGVAATGSDCPYGGYYKCDWCDAGYHKNGNRCLKGFASKM